MTCLAALFSQHVISTTKVIKMPLALKIYWL